MVQVDSAVRGLRLCRAWLNSRQDYDGVSRETQTARHLDMAGRFWMCVSGQVLGQFLFQGTLGLGADDGFDDLAAAVHLHCRN